MLFLFYTANTKTAIYIPFLRDRIPHKKGINQMSVSLSNLILLEAVCIKTLWEFQL